MSTAAVTRSGLSADDDLPAAWAKVIAALEVQANYRLDPEQAPTITQITEDIKPAKADPTTKTKIKNIFTKALICIDRFGGIIASASSTVFPASNQVYNAVSFLIHASQDSQAVFDNLTALMERLSAFLERLNLYLDQNDEEKLGKNLRWSMYQVLEQFVTIMALSYKLTGSWKSSDGGMKSKLESLNRKAKIFIKIGAFGDDSGVKSAIATFERLVSRVTNVQIDEIHRTLSSAARAICDIGEEVHAINSTVQVTNLTVQAVNSTVQESASTLQQMRGDEERKKAEKAVCSALDIDRNNTNASMRAHDDYQNQTADTGNWLFLRSDFRRWLDFRAFPDTSPILTIQGPEGYGKSYLAHAIINRLVDDSRNEKGPYHVRVAWFYISRDSKKASVNQAIRHIILQLAKSDAAYMNYLESATSGYTPSDCENTGKLWSQLVAEYSKRQPASVFFIVLDGIDHVENESEGESDPAIRRVLDQVASAGNDPDGLRIRFLLLGKEAPIARLQNAIDSIPPPINLAPSGETSPTSLEQRDDIAKFVTNKLDAIKKFQPPLSPERQELKDRIIIDLPAGARGNYNVLKQKLREIADSVDFTQIEDVLRRVPEDQLTAIGRELDDLNDRLGGQYIKQLNEIFTWVATAIWPPQGDVLQSVLSMTFQEYALYDPVDYIRSNCSQLLETDKDTGVRFTSSDVETSLRKAEPKRPTIPEAEIDVIQAMVHTNFKNIFGDQKIYDKFGFDRFFQDKRNVQTDLIHLASPQANHLALLETCLKVICDLYDVEKYQPLRDYASDYFDEHLTNVDLALTDTALKQQLGRRLYRMLHENAVIDIWAKNDQMWGMTDWFDDDNEFCANLFDWMKDADIQKSIQTITTETNWLVEVLNENVPKQRLLQHIARRILQRWYDDDDQESSMPFTWLRGYFLKTSEWGKDKKDIGYLHDSTVEEIEEWETWARGEPGMAPETARWHYRMAGVYYRLGTWRRYPDEDMGRIACSRCDKAIQLEPGEWNARTFKGVLLYELKKYQECIEHLEAIASTQAELAGTRDEKYEKLYWESVVPTIARSHMRLQNFDQAAKCYRRLLDQLLANNTFSVDTATHIAALIDAFHQQEDFGSSLELLRTLDGHVIEEKSWLRNVFETPGTEIHAHIIKLALQTETFEDMDSYYERVIQHSNSVAGRKGFLEYNRAKLHWYCGPTGHRESVTIKWGTVLHSVKEIDDWWGYFTRDEGVKELAKSLLSLATQSDLEPVKLQDHIKQLETLCESTDDLSRVSIYRDARLVHARVLHLTGDDVKARTVLGPEMRKAIKRAQEEDEDDVREDYRNLAFILPVLDDDTNALAAWSLLEPNREQAKEDKENRKDVEGEEPITSPEASLTPSASPEAPREPHDNDGAANDEPPPTEPPSPGPNSGTSSTTKKLEGTLTLYCDGGCDRSWTYADDMWVCRDCLCVQLCTACYEKLHAGRLNITVCDPHHSHLHVPAFDEAEWRARDPGSVLVGGELRTRERWLKDLEAEWEVTGAEDRGGKGD